MLDGHNDVFFNNTAVMLFDGDYAKPICEGEGASAWGGNTIYSPTSNVTECGGSVAAWQAKGGDVGTRIYDGTVPWLVFVPNTTTASVVSGSYIETHG